MSDKDMWFSFDEHNIGLIERDGESIVYPLVDRPYGIKNTEWYVFAGILCREVNRRLHPSKPPTKDKAE